MSISNSMNDDIISRKAAIDEIRCYICDPEILISENEDDVFRYNSGLLTAIQALNDLPASEFRWIPVAEQLPKIDMSHPHHDDYLVQYDTGYMDVASWSNVNPFWPDRVTDPYWNCVQFAEVIAWMPLHEPYKGGENATD